MDFLCRRYGGSPFLLLDRYIEAGRLQEFIYEVWNIHNEEEIWEVWLHKVDGKSYTEFRESLEPPKPIDKKEMANTIKQSESILNGFSLKEG